jgi:excinuclease ABC subunit C
MNPVPLWRDNEAQLLLQRIRDEAHRFAIGFHRRQRGKATMLSALDGIAGIGKQRKRALLKHFGSIQNIRKATVEEIVSVPGISKKNAQSIMESLGGG